MSKQKNLSLSFWHLLSLSSCQLQLNTARTELRSHLSHPLFSTSSLDHCGQHYHLAHHSDMKYYVIFDNDFSLDPFIQATSKSERFFLSCILRTKSCLNIFRAKGLPGPSPHISYENFLLFRLDKHYPACSHCSKSSFFYIVILIYHYSLCILLCTILHSNFKHWKQLIFAFQAPLPYLHYTVHILLAVTPFAHISSWPMKSVSIY